MKKRDRIQMAAAIMSVADNRTVTEIAELANLNWRSTCKMCAILERQHLISKSRTREFMRDGEMCNGSMRDRYTLTESGRELLAAIDSVISLF